MWQAGRRRRSSRLQSRLFAQDFQTLAFQTLYFQPWDHSSERPPTAPSIERRAYLFRANGRFSGTTAMGRGTECARRFPDGAKKRAASWRPAASVDIPDAGLDANDVEELQNAEREQNHHQPSGDHPVSRGTVLHFICHLEALPD
jgi:hypothetical protein